MFSKMLNSKNIKNLDYKKSALVKVLIQFSIIINFSRFTELDKQFLKLRYALKISTVLFSAGSRRGK